MPTYTYKTAYQSTDDHIQVTDEHLGINAVATINTAHGDGPFREILNSFDASSIRYPGGTVTEQHLVPGSKLWNAIFYSVSEEQVETIDGVQFTRFEAFVDLANDMSKDVVFVLPTLPLLARSESGHAEIIEDYVEEVAQVVKMILRGDFGEVDIQAFELGNEYYHYPDLTAEEYGKVANRLAKAVDQAIDEVLPSSEADRPLISVQSGAGWRPGDNEKILEQFDEAGLEAIDQVVLHFYPESLGEVGAHDRHFDNYDAWQAATDNKDLRLFVSEWNVHATDDSDRGLAQASTMLAAFAELLDQEVDAASIWGVQSRWLNMSLSTLDKSDTPEVGGNLINTELTPAGRIFQSISMNLEGMRHIDDFAIPTMIESDSFATEWSDVKADLFIELFGDENGAVLYIASRSVDDELLSLNLDNFFGQGAGYRGTVISAEDNPATLTRLEGTPLDGFSIAHEQGLTTSQLRGDNSITLAPYEIIEIKIDISGPDSVLQPTTYARLAAPHGKDTNGPANHSGLIKGTRNDDRLSGSANDDAVRALNGEDVITGKQGDDFIHGGGSSDRVSGGGGDDHLIGARGSDKVLGGSGDDLVKGAIGGDNLKGGAGNDLIYGGKGSDRIDGGLGIDELFGGDGRDTFVFRTNETTQLLGNKSGVSYTRYDTIKDFEVGVDTISFANHSKVESLDDLEIARTEISGEKYFSIAIKDSDERVVVAVDDQTTWSDISSSENFDF